MKNIFLICLFGIFSLQAMENQVNGIIINPCLDREHFDVLNKFYEDASQKNQIEQTLVSFIPDLKNQALSEMIKQRDGSCICSLCGSCLTKPNSIRKHAKMHANREQRKCDFCRYFFPARQIHTHINMCHSDKIKYDAVNLKSYLKWC